MNLDSRGDRTNFIGARECRNGRDRTGPWATRIDFSARRLKETRGVRPVGGLRDPTRRGAVTSAAHH